MATAGIPLWSTTASNNSTADPAVNFAEGQAASSLNDGARALMASVAKWRDDLYGITTGGTSTAYTVATGSTFLTTADMSGVIFTIILHTTSGASPTLAVDGLTAYALNISTGVAVPNGALVSGTPYLVKYVHASTEFIVLGGVGALGNTTITGTLGVAGNFSVNTNKLTVTASNGNTSIAGTLSVTGAATLSSTANVVGNFNVNTNKFSVVAASGNTTVAGTLGVTGLSTLASLSVTGSTTFGGALLSSSASGGIGYTTGAGGTVIQLTSKTTGVTLNKITGQITLAAGLMGNQSTASFTFTNSTIAAGDIIVFNHISGGTTGSYLATAQCGNGAATVTVINWTTANLNEQPVFQYSVIKSAVS